MLSLINEVISLCDLQSSLSNSLQIFSFSMVFYLTKELNQGQANKKLMYFILILATPTYIQNVCIRLFIYIASAQSEICL